MNADAHMPAGDALLPEDAARANLYALIGRLFYAAPDSGLFAQICADDVSAVDGGDSGALGRAWRTLQDTSRSAYAAVVRQEHDTLFVGVGKAEVTPYTSHYVTASAPDRHLVMLREQLARWGLARNAGVFEVEDHISGLCDVMRFLIEQRASLADQRLFFERFIHPGVLPLFGAVMSAPSAQFYRQVVPLAAAFFEIEKAAFDMDDGVAQTIDENNSQI